MNALNRWRVRSLSGTLFISYGCDYDYSRSEENRQGGNGVEWVHANRKFRREFIASSIYYGDKYVFFAHPSARVYMRVCILLLVAPARRTSNDRKSSNWIRNGSDFSPFSPYMHMYVYVCVGVTIWFWRLVKFYLLMVIY